MDIKSFKSFNENSSENINYMFFANLEHICRMAREILEMNESQIDEKLTDGHDWANDHISKSMESISHVYNFLTASDLDSDEVEEVQSQFEEEPHFEEPIEEEPQLEESVKSFKDFK